MSMGDEVKPSKNIQLPLDAPAAFGPASLALPASLAPMGRINVPNVALIQSKETSTLANVVTPTSTKSEELFIPSAIKDAIKNADNSSFLMPRISAPLNTPSFGNQSKPPTNENNDLTPILPTGGLPSVNESIARADTTTPNTKRTRASSSGPRLNKFVRRLHDMLQSEKDGSVVEWRRGLLVLHSTDIFAKSILPRYFNTRNFKTFRRQLNYYGFVHVRSFSTTGSTTTALWVNRDLAKRGTESISSVLMLKRVEPCESAKTAEGRRARKEQAVSTVEDDIGVSAKSLQLEQIRSMAFQKNNESACSNSVPPIPMVVHCHAPPSSGGESITHTSILPRPLLWMSGTESRTESESISSTEEPAAMEVDSSTFADAANLLLMLSKATAAA